MKSIIAVVAALAAMTGCAVQQPYYTSARVQDPYQWHTVSAVPAGGGVQSGTWTEELPAQSAPRVAYTTEQPAYTTTYVAQPVYYAPAPVYYAPAPAYYYPPVSIGLDFSFGHWCCGGRGWGGRGYHRR